MITEAVLNMVFFIPLEVISLIPDLPVIRIGDLSSLLELLAIGNIFFPVGDLFFYLSVWLALSIVSLSKSFIDWILSIIPLY